MGFLNFSFCIIVATGLIFFAVQQLEKKGIWKVLHLMSTSKSRFVRPFPNCSYLIYTYIHNIMPIFPIKVGRALKTFGSHLMDINRYFRTKLKPLQSVFTIPNSISIVYSWSFNNKLLRNTKFWVQLEITIASNILSEKLFFQIIQTFKDDNKKR